jgi:2,4-dienoyl-CoA reductase (NADPH2)
MLPPVDILFQPLQFRNLTVKNRLFRSSISGRIDNYDGSGTPARIHWEERFAKGGVGAIISAHVPIHVRGRILPNYAFIDSDERIPFWRTLVDRVHRYDCKFIMQISHGGRQQDMKGVENGDLKSLSSTGREELFHGFQSRAMSDKEIREVIQQFADAARRAREAGCDGVELHSGNGYLFSQFLCKGINDRTDEWGGKLENRARFLLEVIRAVRKEVGRDFHLQAKLNGQDHNNAVIFWDEEGNDLDDAIQIAKWCEAETVDAIHVSCGSMFPHPRNPPGKFPIDTAAADYPLMLPAGVHTFRNYLLFRYRLLRPIFRWLWERTKPHKPTGGLLIEGINLDDARAIKQAVKIPVMVTGGFQTASVIRKAIEEGACDGVTMARTLIANPDLPHTFAAGQDHAERPCTYCNRCLVNVLEHPLGCYEPHRFKNREEMMRDVMSFYLHTDDQLAVMEQAIDQGGERSVDAGALPHVRRERGIAGEAGHEAANARVVADGQRGEGGKLA